jgi:hypothetical protein
MTELQNFLEEIQHDVNERKIEQKGLLEHIDERIGKDLKDKVEALVNFSNVYVLYLVDIIPVTEKGLKIKFASYQAQFPNRTYEDFLKYRRIDDSDKYVFDIEPQGYFLDEKLAIYKAENNVLDINEGGAYPYVIISSMPLNGVYPYCEERSHRLFLFNKKIGKYEEIDWDYNEGTRYLRKRGNRGGF